MKQLKKKILLFLFALPFFMVINMIITILFISKDDSSIKGVVILTFLILIFLAFKNKLIKFTSLSLNFVDILYSFLIVSILVLIFLGEKIFLNGGIKYPYTLFTAITIVLILPIVEEIFIKKILIDNLILIKFKTMAVFIISVLYFVFLHFPEIHITHISFGMITSYLYIRNKNILQVIIIHILFNFSIMLYNIL